MFWLKLSKPIIWKKVWEYNLVYYNDKVVDKIIILSEKDIDVSMLEFWFMSICNYI